MKEKLTVFGYSGSAEELKTLLEAGLRITAMTQDGSGYVVEFDTEAKVGRPQKIRKEQILTLRSEGKSYAAIGKELGCSKAYVIKVCKQAQPEGCPEPEIAEEDDADRILAAYADYLTDTWAAEYDAVLQSLPKPIPEPEPEVALKQNNLKELRKAAGLSQKALSEKTGIKLKTIQDWERTGKPIDGDVFQYLLARELHCRVEDLPGN